MICKYMVSKYCSGNKFFEHYGLHYIDDRKLYMRELCYYHRHNNKAKWEA